MNVLRKVASLSRLIIREPSGALIGIVVSDVAGALIGRVLSHVAGVGTWGWIDLISVLDFFWLHMDVDGYDDLLYFSGFPFRNL